MKKRKSRQRDKKRCSMCGYRRNLAFCKVTKQYYCGVHKHNLSGCCSTSRKWRRICAICRTKKVIAFCTRDKEYFCATDYHYTPCCANPVSRKFIVCGKCKGLKARRGEARRDHEKDFCSWQKKVNSDTERDEPQVKRMEPFCFALLDSDSRHHGARYFCRLNTKFLYCRVHRHKGGCCEKLSLDEITPDLFHCSTGGTCVPVEYACSRYRALYCAAHACRITCDGENKSVCCVNIFTGRPIRDEEASEDEDRGVACYYGSAGDPDLIHFGATYRCDRFGSTVYYCKEHKDNDHCCKKIPKEEMAQAAKRSVRILHGLYDEEKKKAWESETVLDEKLPEVTFAND